MTPFTRFLRPNTLNITLLCVAVWLAINPGQCEAGVGLDRRIGDTTTYYVDPEFWAPTAQVVWQDNATNDGWIASIDPNTGDMIPADGRGIHLPTKLAPVFTASSGVPSYNGPEFGFNAQGLFVYMTVRDSHGLDQTGRFGPIDRGTAAYKQLSTNSHDSLAALPSQEPSFSVGAYMCYYLDTSEGRVVWRFDNEPTTNRTVPISYIGLKGPRWIPGQLAVSSNAVDGNGVDQAAIVNLAQNTTTRITNDSGNKSEVFIFDAPELGTRAAMCLVGDAHRELAVYKEASPFWQKVASFAAPSFLLGGGSTAQIYLPEPFVFQGQSYFMFAVGKVDVDAIEFQGPSMLYVARLGGTSPVQVGSTIPALRLDPEILVINNKAFLYYYTGVPKGAPIKPQLRVVSDFLPLP